MRISFDVQAATSDLLKKTSQETVVLLLQECARLPKYGAWTPITRNIVVR
jgi:hypothetical protein